jgi:hypothetical protein
MPEIFVDGIVTSNLSVDGIDVTDHSARHEFGGADVVNVNNLSGTLADAQKIAVQSGGTLIGTRATLNFVSGATVTDNGGSNRVDITISGGGGTMDIQENGSTVVTGATILNFQNGVIAASGGGTTGTVNLDYGPTGSVITIQPDATADGGSSVQVARVDHRHAIVADTAIEITDATNSEGVSTSFARADHGHAHGNRGGGTLHAAATTSVAGFMSAADKTKLDNTFTSEMVSVFTGLHSANGDVFITVARQVVNFDKLGTSITFRWNQVAVPTNNAEVRIQNITDATTLGSLTGISTTGLKSFTVTNPTGTKLIYLQHREVVAGAGTSDIEGGILETA